MCLFMLRETMFVVESWAISHANDRTHKWLEILTGEIFHWNSSGERLLKLIESEEDDDNM